MPDHVSFANSRPPVAEAGTTLGRFELRRVLGQGGQSTVWLAFDPRMEREVAIWEHAVDPDHPMLEVTLGGYSDLLQKVGRTKEAEVVQNRLNRLRRNKDR